MGPRSWCDREIRLVLTTFLTPTPTICVKETNLVPEPRRTICLMFDSRRESEADSCLIYSEIVLLEPQICRQYCRQLSVFSNPVSQSQPGRCDDRNSAQKWLVGKSMVLLSAVLQGIASSQYPSTRSLQGKRSEDRIVCKNWVRAMLY